MTACWSTWQLYNFGQSSKVNTKVLTGQTVKRNRWRDHLCHYGQLSWYWDEEWVTCRWSIICASSWLQSWNDYTSNSLLESTTSDSVQRRRFVHPYQSWPAVYRLMRRAPFIRHICRYDSLLKPTGTRLRRLYNSGADLLVTAALITTTVAWSYYRWLDLIIGGLLLTLGAQLTTPGADYKIMCADCYKDVQIVITLRRLL